MHIYRATDVHRLLYEAAETTTTATGEVNIVSATRFSFFAVQAKDHSQQLHARGRIKNQRKPQPPPRRWRRGGGGTKAYT